MKILCIADHIDPRIYTCSIKERFKDIGMVLAAGDLPLEYYSFIVSCLNKPLLFIFGNHHLSRYNVYRKIGQDSAMPDPTDSRNARESGSQYIGLKVRKVKGLLIAGLGGSMWYNGGTNQYSDSAMYVRAFRLIPRLLWNRLIHGRYLDILVTHAPPRGIHDKEDRCHRGFACFLWFMRTFKPRFLIHGHIHLYDLNEPRTTRYCSTSVVNAYDHVVIDTEEAER